MSDARESRLGRLGGFATVVGLFGLPVWAMLTAAIVQVFPGWVGYDPSAMVLQIGTGGVIEMVDARPSLANWALAGGIAAVGVGGLLGVLGLGGILGRAVDAVERRRGAADAARYEAMAGDVVLEGVELHTRSVRGEGAPPAAPEPPPAPPADPSA